MENRKEGSVSNEYGKFDFWAVLGLASGQGTAFGLGWDCVSQHTYCFSALSRDRDRGRVWPDFWEREAARSTVGEQPWGGCSAAYVLTVRVNVSEPNSSAGWEAKRNEKKNKQCPAVQTIVDARAVPRPSILSSLYRLKHCIVSLLISIIYKWGYGGCLLERTGTKRNRKHRQS